MIGSLRTCWWRSTFAAVSCVAVLPASRLEQLVRLARRPGHPRSLKSGQKISEDAYLDQLQQLLYQAVAQVSLPKLCKALREAGITREQALLALDQSERGVCRVTSLN